MRYFGLILFSFTLVLGAGIHQKLIVSADTDIHVAEENLLALKVYFLENSYLRALEDQHHFTLKVERLGDYEMVVIEPIEDTGIKNDLRILLHSLFSEMFFIDLPKRVVKESISKEVQQTSKNNIKPIGKEPIIVKSWIEAIGLQWIILLVLASLGLLLSLLNRRKLSKLETVQKNLQKDQQNVEDDMDKLGALHV